MTQAPRSINVLLTSAGVATASNVMDALRSDLGLSGRIVAVDMDPYAAGLHRADVKALCPPCSAPGYIDTILDICSKENVSFVFPLYSGEIHLFCRAASRFSEIGVNLMLPPLETVRLCTDKRSFFEFLESEGFSFPATYEPVANKDFRFPLFIKPPSGSGSKNTHRIDDAEDLAFYLKKHPDSILQDFIPGTEYTVDCLVDKGRLLACIPRVRVVVRDGKTMVGRTVDHPLLRAETARLLSALGMHGPCNVQFMETPEGKLFIIEVNPRLAAGGLPLSVRAGANIPAMMARLALGETVNPVEDYRRGLVMARYLSDIFMVDGPDGPERLTP